MQYHVSLTARYDTVLTPLTVDVSTGDVITPHAVLFPFGGILDPGRTVELWAYNIETVLAEKVETILRRGVFNTRPRDYYDTYILASTQTFSKTLFREALAATAAHRGTEKQIGDPTKIIGLIRNNQELRTMWEKYTKQFSYAKNIAFDEILCVISDLLSTETD